MILIIIIKTTKRTQHHAKSDFGGITKVCFAITSLLVISWILLRLANLVDFNTVNANGKEKTVIKMTKNDKKRNEW